MPYTPVADREVKSSGYVPYAERLKKLASDTGKVLKDTAQGVAKAPVALAMVPADIASQAINEKPIDPLQIPGVGEVKSYSQRSTEYANEPGYTPTLGKIRAASEGALDAAGLGGVVTKALTPAAVTPPADNFAKGQSDDAATAITNHLTSGKQIMDNLPEGHKKALQTSLIEHTKTNIVDGVKERFPQISDAVAKLDPKAFKSYDEFTSAVEGLLKSAPSLFLFGDRNKEKTSKPKDVQIVEITKSDDEIQNAKLVAGVNIARYAEDPKHERNVARIYTQMPEFVTEEQIDQYIQERAKKSPITARMVTTVADKYKIDPKLILAIIQQDSSFGTKGLGKKTKNPGNYGTYGKRVQKFKTWDAGLDAVGELLAQNKFSEGEKQYMIDLRRRADGLD